MARLIDADALIEWATARKDLWRQDRKAGINPEGAYMRYLEDMTLISVVNAMAANEEEDE